MVECGMDASLLTTISPYLHVALEAVGAIYALATLVGNTAPTTRLGQFCRKYAGDLQTAEKVLESAEKLVPAAAPAVAATPAPKSPAPVEPAPAAEPAKPAEAPAATPPVPPPAA